MLVPALRGLATRWNRGAVAQLGSCLLLPTPLLQLRLIFGRIPRSCSLSDVLPRSGLESCCAEVPLTIPDRPEAQSWIALETRDDGVRDVRVALPHHGQTVCPTRIVSSMPGSHSTAQTQPPLSTRALEQWSWRVATVLARGGGWRGNPKLCHRAL